MTLLHPPPAQPTTPLNIRRTLTPLDRRSFTAVLALLLCAFFPAAAWSEEVKPAAVAIEVAPAPANGEADAPPWLGIMMEVSRNQNLDDDEKPPPGVGVLEAVEGGPAKKAGLKQFDRVLKLDGKELKDAEDLRTTVRANKAGKEVKLRILREGKELDVKVTLEAMPAQQNVIIFQGGAFNPQVKPDKVQFFNRSPRAVEGAGPDVVTLADGNRLEGQVQTVAGAELGFKLKSGSEVVLLLNELASVRLAGEYQAPKLPVGVLLRDGGWLAAAHVGLKDGKFTLTLENGGKVEIDRGQVAEVALSGEEAPVFGRGATFGDGWKSAPDDSWVEKNGAWTCRSNQGAVLGRKFDRLPATLEFSFDAPAQADWVGALTLFSYRLDDAGGAMAPGMLQVGVGGRTISLNHFDGQRFFNLQPIQSDKAVSMPLPARGQPAHYAIYCDRVKGLLALQVNGQEIARYDVAKITPTDLDRAGSVISFRAQAGFTVANPTVRPWYGYVPKPGETVSGEDQVAVADQGQIAGQVVKISDTGVTLASGLVVPRTKPVLLKLRPTEGTAIKPANGLWLEMKNGSALSADSVQLSHGKLTVKTSYAGEISLPVAALRRLNPVCVDPPPFPTGPGKMDTLTFADGRQLTGTYVPPMTDNKLRWKIPAAKGPLEFLTDEVTSLCLATKDEARASAVQVVRLCNGDWLPGEVTGADATAITLRTPFHPALRLDRSGIQAIYPAAGAAVVADAASGPKRWLQTANRNSGQITFAEGRDAKLPAYTYADGAYAMRNTTPDASGLHDGIVLPLAASETAVSMEFTFAGVDNYMALSLLDKNATIAFYVSVSGNTVVVNRAASMDENFQGRFARPEQFIFQLPAKTVISSGMRLQIVPDPRGHAIHLAINGRKTGTCKLRKDEPWTDLRYVMFFPTTNNGRRFTVANTWVAPWNGRLGEAETHAPGEVSVVFSNGDETVAKLSKFTAESVDVDTEAAGTLTLPLARIVSMDLNPPSAPQPATHHIRFHDRGLLSASAVKIGEQSVIITTAHGELTVPLAMVKEITFPKREGAAR